MPKKTDIDETLFGKTKSKTTSYLNSLPEQMKEKMIII
jgi:hypothetical protein